MVGTLVENISGVISSRLFLVGTLLDRLMRPREAKRILEMFSYQG
jgi:hypothetical protein